MLITVDRFLSDKDTTISKVSVDGTFVCYGLEDEHRTQKLPKETRIPAGSYEIRLRTEGGKHTQYQKRFPGFHQGMLWLQDVPGFEFILIHIGNKEEETDGCLLVGESYSEGSMTIGQSAKAYEKVYKMVVEAAKAGDLQIELQDNDL